MGLSAINLSFAADRHRERPGTASVPEQFRGMISVAIVEKPYTADQLNAAIRTIGIRC